MYILYTAIGPNQRVSGRSTRLRRSTGTRNPEPVEMATPAKFFSGCKFRLGVKWKTFGHSSGTMIKGTNVLVRTEYSSNLTEVWVHQRKVSLHFLPLLLESLGK